jgi:hypothetical protein
MENHVKILGVLHIVFGSLGLIAALVILAVFGGVAGVIGAAAQRGDMHASDAQTAIPVLGIIFGVICVFLVVMSLPGIITGVGLLYYREWARILGIVLAAISLPAIPAGTALGVYGLWVLLNNGTVRLFQNPPPRGARSFI